VINELGVSKKNIVVIQSAVDNVRFCPVDDKVKSELRAKLGLPVERIVVLVPMSRKTILIWSMAVRLWVYIRSFSQGVQNILANSLVEMHRSICS